MMSLRAATKVLRRVLSTQQGSTLIEPQAPGEALKLAGQEVLWCDVDCFSDLLAQGCRARTPEEAQHSLEQAHALLCGDLLANEQGHEWSRCRWVKLRQQTLWVERCQLVRRLADLYLDQGETERAEDLLEAHVVRFPSDQDALLRLLKLLLAHESAHEALVLYQRAQRALAANGVRPNKYLSQLGEHLLRRLEPPEEPSLSSSPQMPVQPMQQDSSPTLPALHFQPGDPIPDLLSALAVFLQAHGPGMNQNGASQVNGYHSAASRLCPLYAFNHLVSPGTSLDGSAAGAWIAQAAGPLGMLFEQGWSIEALLEVLQVILPVIKAMPMMTRHTFLQAGTATALLGRFPVFESKQISEEEAVQFCQAFSESCIRGWNLFHSAGMGQVLAIGQALLLLLQPNHALFPPRLRSVLYTCVYNLIGCALHAQEHHEAALDAHSHAQIAAMGTGSPLHVAQSLICQASSYQALGHYSKAEQVLEEAHLLLQHSSDEDSLRVKAHVLACWADVVMAAGERPLAQQKLEASTSYLDQITPNEEFDWTSWLQLAGKHALYVGDYHTAIHHFEQALAALPAHLLLQTASILLPLAAAYLRAGEREASLMVANKALSVVARLNAQMTNKHLVVYLRQDVLPLASGDGRMRAFVQEVYAQLPHLASLIGSER